MSEGDKINLTFGCIGVFMVVVTIVFIIIAGINIFGG